MSIGRYVLGLCLVVGCVGPVALGSRRVRMRLLPGAERSIGLVADAVLALGLIVVALELPGLLGLLTPLGALVACVALGGAAWLGAGLITPPETGRKPSRRPPDHDHRITDTLVIAALAAVGAVWVGQTIFAYRHGMQTVDTLWYHLPVAARFVQTGSILHLQYVDSEAVTVFYPANSSLFHAFGLLLFGDDVLSPVIDLGWAALALTAAWAIGRAFGRGPHCLIAVLLALGTPTLVDTQPGGGYDDIVCVALLLSAIALLVAGSARHTVDRRAGAVAAIAAGLAIGTKFTMIAPTLALGVGAVVISRPGARLRQALIWAAGLITVGGYWYVRNAVLVGNPLPALAIHLGPLSLPAPRVGTPTFTVAQYLTQLHIWRAFYVPGLREALGPAWWAILGLSAIGAIGAIVAGADRTQRMLGVVTVVSAVAFLLTPQFLGLPGAPIYFVDNVRYASGPIAMGLVLLPALPIFRPARRAAWLVAVCAAALIATELDPGVWPSGIDLKPFVAPLHGGPALAGALVGAVVLVGGLAWVWRGLPRDPDPGGPRLPRLRSVTTRPGGRWSRAGGARPRAAVGVGLSVALVIVAAAGWGVASSYGDRRYADAPPFPRIYRWAQSVQHARIGIVGFVEQYPLYGSHDSNVVSYVGASEPHRGFAAITGCRQWREAVDRGRYGWLVVAASGFEYPLSLTIAPEAAWTRSSPAASAAISEHPTGSFPGERVILFRIRGRLDPNRCPAGRRRGSGTGSSLGLA